MVRPDKERIRVSRACDRCKRKKIRCSGTKPCVLCIKLGIECQFNARYTRGRLPQIEGLPEDDPQTPLKEPDSSTRIPEPSTPVTYDIHSTLPVPETDSAIHSSRNSPEPSQTDRQGHYIGPSSAVSFLLRAQKRLHKIVSLSPNSSIFTFGDSPLPDFDSSFFILPPVNKARSLVARYFDFAVPTHRYLHRGTVETWLEDLYAKPGNMKPGDRGIRAVIFMVFAQASEYMPKDNGVPDSATCASYFQAAEHQLRGETGEIRLTSIQARLLQCFWLLSESRINHCWSLFGTTAHLLLALGLHRKRRRDNTSSSEFVDAECRKRVFWSAYTLDIYLSAALGRPRTFHDDDIDQELPSLLDDAQLSSNHLTPKSKTQSIMLGPVYHAKLAQIISLILKDLYGIRPVKSEIRLSLARKHTSELRRWRQGISHFLDIDSSLLSPLFQRQNTVLRLAYAHALILVHRPSLLSNFAELSRQNRVSRASTADVGSRKQAIKQESVQECLDAAMSIAHIINELCERGQNYPTFWFTHYYSFCAIVILYVYAIQSRHEPASTWRSYFDAGQKCQRQLASLKAVTGSFAQRYSIVLEELRIEVLKQIASVENPESRSNIVDMDRERDADAAETILRLADTDNHPSLHPSSTTTSFENSLLLPEMQNCGTDRSAHFDFDNPSPSITLDASPSSLTGDHISMMMGTGWEDFDSFVTAGVGAGGFLDSGLLDPDLQQPDVGRARWDFDAAEGLDTSILGLG